MLRGKRKRERERERQREWGGVGGGGTGCGTVECSRYFLRSRENHGERREANKEDDGILFLRRMCRLLGSARRAETCY